MTAAPLSSLPDELVDQLCKIINEKINIPFLSEAQEFLLIKALILFLSDKVGLREEIAKHFDK